MIHPKNKSKLVFATNNAHKFKEIRDILTNQIELLSLADIGFSDEIPEDHETLEENAAQKAYFIYNKFGIDCFSDDTGLEIEALNGAPGVYSARYAGEKCTFDDNMNLVLRNMAGIENRKAKFRTVIALVEKGKLVNFEGAVRGTITQEKIGNSGFGYDPVFIPEGYNRTFAEMALTEKNLISHRALAVKEFAKYVLSHL